MKRTRTFTLLLRFTVNCLKATEPVYRNRKVGLLTKIMQVQFLSESKLSEQRIM